MNEADMLSIEQSTRRQHFTDVRHVNVRWEPYKPDGARQMKARGRWQEQVGLGDYWRWQNCDRPAFAHDPDLTEQIAALTAERDALRAQVDALVAATKRLPDGEWETWTSCSFRRISRVGGGDGSVLHAYKQPADGHPDLSWTEDQCKAICDIVNGLRALAQQEGAKG
jgi:hypothetical protein